MSSSQSETQTAASGAPPTTSEGAPLLGNIDEERPATFGATTTEEWDHLNGGNVDNVNTSENNDNENNNNDDDDNSEDDNRTTTDFSIADISAMVEAAVEEVVESVVDAVREEAHDVAEIVVEEFQDVNENDFHYLEMGLTRNLSILPADIVKVAEGVGGGGTSGGIGDDDVSVLTLETQKIDASSSTTPLSAYFLLLSAVVSLSSIGPLLVLQDNATPTMKIVWRMTGTSILLFPMAAYDVFQNGFPKLTTPQWITFLLATTCYDIMTLSFVLSLSYTAVGNAVILANSLALILLVGKIFVGDPVTALEGCGAVVAFLGAALCSKDSAETTNGGGGNDGGVDTSDAFSDVNVTATAIDATEMVETIISPSNPLLGDALAIFAAIGGVGYLIFAKTSRTNMSMYVFMFLTMFVGAFLAWVFQVLILGEASSFDMDYNHGIFGFLLPLPDRLQLEFVTIVVCNVCGTMGYVRAMQYFDNLIISSAALLEPVIAEFLAFGFGVGSLPGYQGWLGNALVAGGTFAVIYKDGKGKSPAGGH